MRIDIAYDSCWQNSFLTGDNNKPVDRYNERKFKCTSKSKIIDKREVSLNTVMGVLCRLIGDQQKLYQSRNDKDYYFKDIESCIEFKHRKRMEYQETAFIVNKSDGRAPQGSFFGVLPNDNALFFSEYAKNIWQVLDMSFYELLSYILHDDRVVVAQGYASPKNILSRIDEIQSMEPYQTLTARGERLAQTLQKAVDNITVKNSLGKKITEKEYEKIKLLNLEIESLETPTTKELDRCVIQCADKVAQKYSDKPYIDQGKLYPMSLYAAALYIALERLKIAGVDTSAFINKNNNIQGFNPYGFNGTRDFLNPLTGGKKRCGGTPTQLTKASGVLEITLNVSKERANEIKMMIENAGVSAFYLGKKGLAYVEGIR